MAEGSSKFKFYARGRLLGRTPGPLRPRWLVLLLPLRSSVQCRCSTQLKVSKDMSLKVLRRRLRVLDKFRHCIVCRHVCQKQTESGWEVVGDKHTAVPWSGTGLVPYPNCADQTLSPEEKAALVKMRGRKVWRMKPWVKQLMQKAKDKEIKEK